MSTSSTTLNTFLFRAPEGTFSVELLGSWDNFNKPYKLSRDRKTGDNNWRGCHVYQDIACDGDTSDLSERRNGGLMMGGTYWYYYRLNSETEQHDPVEPYTTSCPLLPGQPVNVLDVPIQPPRTYSGNDSSDSLDSLVFTLDPRDKYLPPGVRRARTTSAIQQRKPFSRLSPKMPLTTKTSNDNEADLAPQIVTPRREDLTLRPQRSLVSIFDKMRRTKSAGSSPVRATTSWHRKVFPRAGSRSSSRAGSPKKSTEAEDIPAVPQVPAYIIAASKSNSRGYTPTQPIAEAVEVSPPASTTAAEGSCLSLDVSGKTYSDALEALAKVATNLPQLEIHNTSLQGKFGAPNKDFPVTTHIPEQDADPSVDRNISPPASHEHELQLEPLVEPPTASSVFHAAAAALRSPSFQKRKSASIENHLSVLATEAASMLHVDLNPESNYADSSYATDDNFSPNIASNSTQSGPMSPIQLSQPETPTMSEFDDDAISWRRGSDSLDVNTSNMRPPSRAPPPPPSQKLNLAMPFRLKSPPAGFQGYSLPQGESGSTHTIRKPPSITVGQSQHLVHHQTSSKDLVHSWNDGSEHRMTGLEELVDDLGYLGAIIV